MHANPTRSERWYVLAILLVGAALFLATWVFASQENSRDVAASGGNYVEGVIGVPQRVNPVYRGLNPVDDDLSALVFSGLTRMAGDGRVVPDLAESWEISEDGQAYRFTLRDGLLWQDGEEVTAADVVFTWSVLAGEEFNGDAQLGAFWQTVEAVAESDTVVRFRLEEAFSPFLAQTTIGILPEHLLANLAPDEVGQSEFNRQPVGTGPYRLDSLTPEGATLEANPAFHMGRPYLDSFELRFFPGEADAMQALLAGSIDGLLLNQPVGAEQVAAAGEDVAVEELTQNSYSMLYLNHEVPAFQDDRVRRAIAFALDRERLIEVAGGLGTISDSVITPGTWAWTGAFEPYAHDPARATALLDEAGWTTGSDGVRARDGERLAFDLVTNNDATRTAVAAEIATQLAEVGVRVTSSSSEGEGLYAEVLVPHDFEMALFGFASDIDPDPFPAWHSAQASEGANIAGISASDLDGILAEARVNPDRARRAELYVAFQQIFYERQPSIVLFYPTSLYLRPAELSGWQDAVLFSPSSRFHNVWEWFSETRRVSE
ncbi:MAG: hypothetical protein GEU28_08305 [Dehalococcoidia bacterium]|nr:hypothetical protein [Dehalococcoidia bacterium]